MKLVTILGARPQFIKAGTVSREIAKQAQAGADIQEVIIHTGQHYDANMSDIFFEEMKIPKPDYQLGIGGSTHGAMTGNMIEKIERILIQENPNWVLVYGDTNSTLAGAIAASKLKIKIAHVEAGLRSFNMDMPEEINRILTDRISTLLFCPTKTAFENLKNDGIDNWKTGAKALITGDVMLDGAQFYRNKASKPSGLKINNDYVLCTLHRAENTDNRERLKSILATLREISSDKQVLLPLHPRTRKIIADEGHNTAGLTIVDPVGYLNMVWLIDNCSLVMTDSGGLQKEAYFFGKPCITLRDETEWVELVELGVNVLAGADEEVIRRAYTCINQLSKQPENSEPYGTGLASEKIVSALLEYRNEV